MTFEHEILWQQIKAFELDEPNATLTFTDRLARENGWSIEYTLRVIDEYKKFMFLLCISDQPLTPSDQVDQVWHLHLLYTHSYWIDFCQNTINRKIHHGPTKGGKAESSKFMNWYKQTHELYKISFDCHPPLDIWPPPEIEFSNLNFQRISRKNNWVIKKPALFRK